MSQPSWGKWGSWEETETYLDTVIGVVEGPDAVEKGSIRRWLEPKEFDCPLHYDEKTAYDVGYDGIIAPGVMAITYGVDAYWKPEVIFSRKVPEEGLLKLSRIATTIFFLNYWVFHIGYTRKFNLSKIDFSRQETSQKLSSKCLSSLQSSF